jgi:hypothetical protein
MGRPSTSLARRSAEVDAVTRDQRLREMVEEEGVT